MNGERGSDNGGGEEASERLLVGGLENVGESDVPTDGDAQVSGGGAEGEVRPRAGGNVGAELGKGPVIPRGDDTGFILVDTEARKSGKSEDDGESRGDVRDMEGRHCQVIRKSKTLDVGEGGEGSKEGVVGKDENQRGKKATLFDATQDVNPNGDTLAKRRGNLDI